MNYILLSPVKNEEKYIGRTLQSVCNQTILPKRWIILDDDSTDNTPDIVHQFHIDHPWIELISLKNFRPDLLSTGGRSGALLNYARGLIKNEEVDFVVKIDSDIAFEPDFFERFFTEFRLNDKLGLASGHLVQDGTPEKIIDWNSNRGATRIYRKACFDDIGYYYTMRGEDVIDTYVARLKGWQTRTFPIPFDHLKPEGIRNSSLFNHFETGQYKGRIPYRFDFFLLTVIKNIWQKPLLLGSLVQLGAYLKYRWLTPERPFDKAIGEYIRSEQKRKLLSAIKVKATPYQK